MLFFRLSLSVKSRNAETLHGQCKNFRIFRFFGCKMRDDIPLMHMRKPNPRQKRFRKDGGRGDGALRIGDFLILKNAAGIRFSAVAAADPEIVSPRRFFGYLLSAQKVTYKTIMEDCDSLESRGPQPRRAEARNSLTFGAPSAGRDPKTFPLRRLRLFEPHSSPPPHATDCYSLSARACPPPSANSVNSFASLRRYLRRLAQSATPAAARSH